MTYAYSFMVLDDKGDIVLEVNLTSDQGMDLVAQHIENINMLHAEELKNRPIVEGGGDQEDPRASVGKKKKAEKIGKKQRVCSICGRSGHDVRKCPQGKGMHPDNQRDAQPSERSDSMEAPRSVAFNVDRYEAVREAMQDHDFQSAKYALTNRLSPKEVNATVRSTDYENYLEIRS